jgi:hypothetical protein
MTIALNSIVYPQIPHTNATHGIVAGRLCSPSALVGICTNVGIICQFMLLHATHSRDFQCSLSQALAKAPSTSLLSAAFFWASREALSNWPNGFGFVIGQRIAPALRVSQVYIYPISCVWRGYSTRCERVQLG